MGFSFGPGFAGELLPKAVEDEVGSVIEFIAVVVTGFLDMFYRKLTTGRLTPILGATYPLADVP